MIFSSVASACAMSHQLRRLEPSYLIPRADIAVRPLDGWCGLCSPIGRIAGGTSCGARISAGRFYVLSSRPPQDNHQLFTVETKEFEPALSPGDKLVFSLRANATVSRPRGDTKRAGKRDDVVMAALNAVPSGERAAARKELIRREGLAWLRRQGVAAGFEFDERDVRVDGYQPLTIRGDGNNALKLSVIELDGMLTVRDPNIFLGKLARGFGRGKAFGLGLMLIRRRSA